GGERSTRPPVVTIMGHVDHGKTALVRALTGIDTDRLVEEKRRGLSIESGVAPLTLDSGAQTALVDVPGHTDFMKNTIRGLSGIDMAVLVVAADDGVMPQTIEHLEILEFFGVKNGFTVLSKADLVDGETLELAEMEIGELTEGTFLARKPILPFSALDRRGLEGIREAIGEEAGITPGKDPQGPFRLWIDQIKGFSGFGTVASGTVLSGRISTDDPLVLLPAGHRTRARSLQSHHRSVHQSLAGQRVGINLSKVPVQAIARGMLLTEPQGIEPGYLINCDLRISRKAHRPLRNRQRVKLCLGTSVTNALAVIMEREQLEPGEAGLVQFRLMKPAAALPHDPFLICVLNLPSLIGGGTVLEVPGGKYRKAKAAREIPYLRALQEREIGMGMDLLFQRHMYAPLTAEQIARKTVFSGMEIEKEMKRRREAGDLLSFGSAGFIGRSAFQGLKEDVFKAAEDTLKADPLKDHVNAETIRARLSSTLDQGVFQKSMEELCIEGRFIKTDGGYRIQNLALNLTPRQQMLAGLVLDYAERSGLVPFSADTIWKLHNRKHEKKEIQRILNFLKTQERLIILNDKRFLSLAALEEIKARVGRVIRENGGFSIPDCKETLGYGRSVAIPVLEYLDTIGYTRRQDNGRVLMKEK
ncbi:MAG: selenocysteine-specific translation elongation factor, partial [Deltaproteobacteria bacterium]|nr:selenocysteine-specific translation elongation factor [Deltaproteobacteria bacterium]